jgi:hypothetical protein
LQQSLRFLQQLKRRFRKHRFFGLQQGSQQGSQQGAGAQQTGAGAQQTGAGAQQAGAGAQQAGAGAQQAGAGAQQPLSWCDQPNRPASAEFTLTQQVSRAAAKVNHFISKYLLETFSSTGLGGNSGWLHQNKLSIKVQDQLSIKAQGSSTLNVTMWVTPLIFRPRYDSSVM